MEDENEAALAELLDGVEAEMASPSKMPRLEPETKPESSTVKIAASNPHSVLVNPKQKGNPLLKAITSVPWEFDDIIPDYVMGPTTCALFLSLRYHNMNPDYIHERLKLLGKSFELRVLLIQVDLVDPHVALKNLTRICLLADLTLMLAWSAEEAGKVIETYKIYENKPPDRIMERVENDPHQKITNALISIKPVNKTDSMTLLSTFGSLKNIILAPESKLANCPGFGARKASRLHKILHQPFLKSSCIPRSTAKEKEITDPNDEEELDMDELETIMQKENA